MKFPGSLAPAGAEPARTGFFLPRTEWLLACGLAALVSSASIHGQTPSCVNPPGDIGGWWTGDLGIVDSIGGNNAVLVGSAGFGVGKVNQGFSFDGNGYLVLKASSQIDLGTAAGFTIETWIKPSTVVGQWAVFEWNSGGPSGVSLYLSVIPPYGSGNGCLCANLVDTAGAAHVLTTAAGLIQENQFQHIALTYDKTSGGAALYLNGTLASFQLLGSFVPRTSYDLLVGYGVSSGTPAAFVGSVDEISLYRRALSQTEIANIFNAGSAGKCHAPVPPDAAPVITTQPQSVVANYGDNVTLTVAVQSTETLTYQWRRDGTAIVGGTSPSLVLTGVRVGDAGQYTVAEDWTFGKGQVGGGGAHDRILLSRGKCQAVIASSMIVESLFPEIFEPTTGIDAA
jgi:Concanavalin A-like lectin/glucanases superfamily/Immunoglobulin domain